MKKHLLSMFALASMVFATSCTQEEIVSQSTGNEVSVTFKTELRNDVKSRAVGENAHQIDQVEFAVYGETGYLGDLYQAVTPRKGVSADGEDPNKMYAEISVILVKGQTYSFAFWAQDKDYDAYEFAPATATVSVEYGKTTNNYSADAFFAKINDFTVTGTFEQTVTLKRPFAQVNFLTTPFDLEKAKAAGFEPSQSSIVVENAATSLNLLDGNVSGSTAATFNLADIVAATETTTIKNSSNSYITWDGTNVRFSSSPEAKYACNFRYLATAYFLPTEATGEAEITASMSVTGNTTKSVDLTAAGITAQRNYRTNIYGNLLTSNGQFHVVVDPGFDGDYSTEEEDPTTQVVGTIDEANALFNPTDGSTPATNVTITEAPTTASTINLPASTDDATVNFAFEEGSTPAAITIAYAEGAGDTEKPANIEVNGNAGDLVIDAPNSTVTLNGEYNSVTATTKPNTLYVPKGVKIGTLTLKQGNAEIYYGAVTTLVKENGYNGTITWTVDSKEQLAQIATDVNAGKTFIGETIALISDIDLNNENWTSIGTSEKNYLGTFDGNGHTIKNLTIIEEEAKEGKAYIGFFGYAKNATIKNVTFENVNINIPCLDIDHSQGHIGAVAGSLEGTSTIEDVTVKGNIKVEATFDANGASRVAVVAGGNSDGNVTMKNVHVIANEGSYLKANNNVGALAGQLQVKNVFENCSSNIDVTGKKFFAGGLIGLAAGDSKFTNCHTTGDVTITEGREGRANDHYRVGGIAGGWADGKTKVCILENCSYTGTVSGTNADGSVAEPLDYAGYVGRGYTLTNCAGSKVIIDDVSYVQAHNTTFGLYLVDNAYEVKNVAGLVALSGMTIKGGESVKLIADVNLEEVEFNGLNAFNLENNNTFDGQGHTISNWNYELGAADMGFIKNWVGPIKNVNFYNCHLKTGGRSAVVAAKVYGNIDNVKVDKCSVDDSYWVCGIIAGLYNSGSISNCIVTNSSVKSNGGTGGIVGVINESTGERAVRNCSVSNSTINNTGVYGDSYSGGGLIGIFNVDGASYVVEKCTVSGNKLEGSYIFEKYPADDDVTEML